MTFGSPPQSQGPQRGYLVPGQVAYGDGDAPRRRFSLRRFLCKPWVRFVLAIVAIFLASLAAFLAGWAIMDSRTREATVTALPTPNPGCGFVSAVWYDPCYPSPPQPGQGRNWYPVDGVPGQYGSSGYTPCQSDWCA